MLKETSCGNIGVLPLVGIGSTYNKLLSKTARLSILEPRRTMPSGGFCAKSTRWLWADIRSGLIPLLLAQYKTIRSLVLRDQCLIIAVGDTLPLAMSYLSGGRYVYVQVKKSDHMWIHHKDRPSYWWYSLRGTNWNPLEIVFAKSKRCALRFTRDVESSINLSRLGISAYPANPMMDNINIRPRDPAEKGSNNIICLPGSRSREAESNFKLILNIIKLLIKDSNQPLTFLVPLATTDMVDRIRNIVLTASLSNTMLLDEYPSMPNIYGEQGHWIICGKGMLKPWAQMASVGISMAGTATEQVAGMGIPCVTISGRGPQFNRSFAERQHRLLGKSTQLATSIRHAAKLVFTLLNNKNIAIEYGKIGIDRMNSLGGSQYIAAQILSLLRCECEKEEALLLGGDKLETSQKEVL